MCFAGQALFRSDSALVKRTPDSYYLFCMSLIYPSCIFKSNHKERDVRREYYLPRPIEDGIDAMRINSQTAHPTSITSIVVLKRRPKERSEDDAVSALVGVDYLSIRGTLALARSHSARASPPLFTSALLF